VTARRVRDFAVYFSIAIAVVLLIVWGSMHSIKPGAEVIGKWGGLAVNTLIVFGYTIRHNRPSLRRAFWALILLLFVVHAGVFMAVLGRLAEWKVAWWAVVTPAEYFLIRSVIVLAGHRRGDGRRHSHS